MGDGVSDGMVGEAVGRVGPQSPAAARRHPLPQFDVAAAVERRPQRCHEGEAVGGVVGGPQREQQRADLRRRVHDRRVLGPIGQRGVAERGFERGQGDPCGEQHADVARDARTQRVELLVVHEPPVGQGGGDRGHDVARLDHPQRVGGAHLGVADVGGITGGPAGGLLGGAVGDLRTEHVDRAVAQQVGSATGVEGAERRLHVGIVGDDAAEHVVDEVDDGGRRAEVGGEDHLVGADLLGRTQILGDVGAAEPVDRLFRVADDEQPAGFGDELSPVGVVRRIVGARRQPDRDLELDRVGVLELVEHDALVAGVEQPPDVGALGHETAGEHEQVVELEPPGDRPFVGAVEHEPTDDRAEHDAPMVARRREQALGLRAELEFEAAQRLRAPTRPTRRGASSTSPCSPAWTSCWRTRRGPRGSFRG